MTFRPSRWILGAIVLGLAALGACHSSSLRSVACVDDSECPGGATCDLATGTCVGGSSTGAGGAGHGGSTTSGHGGASSSSGQGAGASSSSPSATSSSSHSATSSSSSQAATSSSSSSGTQTTSSTVGSSSSSGMCLGLGQTCDPFDPQCCGSLGCPNPAQVCCSQDACTLPKDCCQANNVGQTCTAGQCVTCQWENVFCTKSSQCCSGVCQGNPGFCTCIATGALCNQGMDCCSHTCNGGICG